MVGVVFLEHAMVSRSTGSVKPVTSACPARIDGKLTVIHPNHARLFRVELPGNTITIS